ncbi:MAG: TolC family protein [Bacteroidota bacterium]
MAVAILPASLQAQVVPNVSHEQVLPVSAKKWSLQDCIDYAMKNNIQLKQQALNAESSKIALNQSYYNALPSVNAAGNQSYNAGGRSVNPYDNTVVENTTFRTNSMNINAGMNIYNGMQNTNAIRRNKVNLEASLLDIQDRTNTTILNLVQAYVNILSSREQLNAAKLQLATTTLQVDRSKVLVTAGALAEANLLNLVAQAATEEVNIITYENNVELARLSLLQIMQKPADEPFDISVPGVEPPSNYALENTAREIYSFAEVHQPVIKAANARIQSAMLSKRIATGALAPTLSVSAGYYTSYSQLAKSVTYDKSQGLVKQFQPFLYDNGSGVESPIYTYGYPGTTTNISFGDQFDNNLRSNLTFNLSIPIFNGLSARSQIYNARITERNAELNRDAAKNTLRQTIEQAYLAAKLSSKQYNANVKQVGSLRESFRANEQRFNVGSMNSVDYNQAKNNLNKAETDLIRAKYDFVVKAKVLDFYQGKDLSF